MGWVENVPTAEIVNRRKVEPPSWRIVHSDGSVEYHTKTFDDQFATDWVTEEPIKKHWQETAEEHEVLS